MLTVKHSTVFFTPNDTDRQTDRQTQVKLKAIMAKHLNILKTFCKWLQHLKHFRRKHFNIKNIATHLKNGCSI
jgi:hypothetical protein